MLKELILKARKKPKHVRDNIAFAIAGSVSAAICLVWLVVMPGQLAKKATSVNDDHKVFSTFFNQFKDQVANVKKSLPEVPATDTPAVVSATTSVKSSLTELTASSSDWSLSSSTIKSKSIQKEVPIMIIHSGSSSASTSPTEPNR